MNYFFLHSATGHIPTRAINPKLTCKSAYENIKLLIIIYVRQKEDSSNNFALFCQMIQ